MYTYETSEQTGKKNDRRGRGGIDSRLFIGVLLVLTGFILIAENLNLLSYELRHILISWPMAVIAIGLFNLARKAYTPGYILVALGLFFLTPRMIDVPYNFYRNFWPAVLIVIGVIFLAQRNRFPHRHNFSDREGFMSPEDSNNSYIDETSIFGGRNVTIVNDNFTGGKITSIFGGSKINLLYSKPAPGCTIDVANIFGGTKIIVPEDWNVKVEVTSVFGGFEDKRPAFLISKNDPNKMMVVKGSCIFGGGEVTSIP